MAARIIETVPEEMLRERFEVKIAPDDDAEEGDQSDTPEASDSPQGTGGDGSIPGTNPADPAINVKQPEELPAQTPRKDARPIMITARRAKVIEHVDGLFASRPVRVVFRRDFGGPRAPGKPGAP